MRARAATTTLWALLAVACGGGDEDVALHPPVDAATVERVGPREPASGRVVYDLLTNRPMAHLRLSGNLVLDGGSPTFWKYVDGGWKSNWFPVERDEDKRVALVQGIAGVVRFPVEADDGGGDLRVAFTLRPAAAHQSLSVFLNEQPIANLACDDEWKTYTVTLPRAHITVGDNALRFHFRAAGTIAGKHSAAAFERILVGPRDARVPGATPRAGASYALAGDARPSLSSREPARWSWYLTVPPATRLELAYGTQSPGSTGTHVTAHATAVVDGKPPIALWQGELGPSWQRATVDLAPVAGETVRLDLALDGPGAFAEPRLVADAPRPERPKAPLAEHAPDHVIVWMVDTLRADRLAAWNPKTVVHTPGFDELGREATRFSSTTVQGNYSLPSHASLLTGTLPPVHHMEEEKDRLDPRLPLVSEELQHAGFATGIFSSNGYVSDKWGFQKGWDAYRNFIREDKPNGADEVWKAARAWLGEQAKAGRRTFLYLATVEPHVAYDPKQRFLDEYWKRTTPYRGPIKPSQTSEQLYQIKLGKLHLTDEDKRYLEALYDAEVTQNDAAFLQMLGDLKQMGLYDKTAIVLVSDHGDELFDHGSVGHGHSVYQELVDVPLYVRWPALYPEGKSVGADVEVIDVYSTLLELAGAPANPEAQGEPLSTLARDDGPRMERPAASFHDGAIRSLRLGRWKLITWSGARMQLFDLATDPHEQHDLARDRPVALRCLRDAFSLAHAFEARWHKTRWGVATDLKPAFADDVGM